MRVTSGTTEGPFQVVLDISEERAYLPHFVVVAQCYDPLAYRGTGYRNESDLVWVEIR